MEDNGFDLDNRQPSKTDFNVAGRVDLRRAVEKWGGVKEVMELLLNKDENPANVEEPESDVAVLRSGVPD